MPGATTGLSLKKGGYGAANSFPTKLPLTLIRPIILCVSDPGDLGLVPFAGSGTAGVAPIENQCRFIGIEQNPDFALATRHRIATCRK